MRCLVSPAHRLRAAGRLRGRSPEQGVRIDRIELDEGEALPRLLADFEERRAAMEDSACVLFTRWLETTVDARREEVQP